MLSIAEKLTRMRAVITSAEQKYGREHGSVALIAVSKTQTVESVEQAIYAGQKDFAENYVQEAVKKIQLLEDHQPIWHFIGPVQSNKTLQIARHFSWVHSVDRLRIARRLNDQRPADLPPLKICVQINISDEISKSGISPQASQDLLEQIPALSRLELCGLMAMPKLSEDFDTQRQAFRDLFLLSQQFKQQGFNMDVLSMGTSQDIEAAIAEGSTMVRIGTSIFGTRK